MSLFYDVFTTQHGASLNNLVLTLTRKKGSVARCGNAMSLFYDVFTTNTIGESHSLVYHVFMKSHDVGHSMKHSQLIEGLAYLL